MRDALAPFPQAFPWRRAWLYRPREGRSRTSSKTVVRATVPRVRIPPPPLIRPSRRPAAALPQRRQPCRRGDDRAEACEQQRGARAERADEQPSGAHGAELGSISRGVVGGERAPLHRLGHADG
jgi:hypothetical protein